MTARPAGAETAPLVLDGSHDEGGGQILRTALGLAVAVGRPVRLSRIRARRPGPGLQPQHLTVVRALAQVSGAAVSGDVLGSTELSFAPGALRGGDHRFDIGAVKGSAGSVTLLFQALLLALLRAPRASHLVLAGGTHVPWSPPFHYLADVFLPAASIAGVKARIALRRWGWYPAGGGEMETWIEPSSALRGLTLTAVPPPLRLTGISAVSRLPRSIAERQRRRAEDGVRAAGLDADVAVHQDMVARSPGTLLFLALAGRAGFSALGRRGLPAEAVADEAVAQAAPGRRAARPWTTISRTSSCPFSRSRARLPRSPARGSPGTCVPWHGSSSSASLCASICAKDRPRTSRSAPRPRGGRHRDHTRRSTRSPRPARPRRVSTSPARRRAGAAWRMRSPSAGAPEGRLGIGDVAHLPSRPRRACPSPVPSAPAGAPRPRCGAPAAPSSRILGRPLWHRRCNERSGGRIHDDARAMGDRRRRGADGGAHRVARACAGPAMTFRNRMEAGRALAERLAPLITGPAVVAAIPRGGVEVALPIVERLHVPLTLAYARKLTAPIAPELAFGAVDEDGQAITDAGTVAGLGLTPADVAAAKWRVAGEIVRRMALYRLPPLGEYLPGRAVILVDDGLATGLTMQAAVAYARRHGARDITVAVPCASGHAARLFGRLADRVVSLIVDDDFMAVGQYYEDFSPVSDDRVCALLAPAPPSPLRISFQNSLGLRLTGELLLPLSVRPAPAVVFAHGWGSSKASTRNRAAAEVLRTEGIAAFLFDFTGHGDSEGTGTDSTPSQQLADLREAIDTLDGIDDVDSRRLAVVGASSGAAAALLVAAERPDLRALVLRSASLGDAAVAAPRVRVPTLLIVGELDAAIRSANEAIVHQFGGERRLVVVAGGDHLFEAADALRQATAYTVAWCKRYLAERHAPGRKAAA